MIGNDAVAPRNDPSRKAALPQGLDAYQRLLEEIRSGNLLPGDRLIETDLADRLNISRTPVREAIRQLEADGLITHLPRTGATVRRLDYSEVIELYEMRAVLEGTAARLAARAASEPELAEIAEADAAMAAADVTDAGRLYTLNLRFHAMVLNAARNRYLAQSLAALDRTLLILGPSTMLNADRARAAVAEHGAVMRAVAARDGAAAEAAMRAHIEAAQRMRMQQLAMAGELR